MEIETLKNLVQEHWGIFLSNFQLLKNETDRRVWSAYSGMDRVAIKLKESNYPFPIILNDELGKAGISPPVWKTLEGRPYIKVNEGLIFVTSYINKKLQHNAGHLMDFIGSFHRKARYPWLLKDYAPKNKLNPSSWLNFYRMRKEQLQEWSNLADSPQLENGYKSCLDLVNQSIQVIESQDLETYLNWSYRNGTIIHGDIHGANFSLSTDERYIFDFDWSRFGPQAFDLHTVVPMANRWNEGAELLSLFDIYFSSYPEAKKFRSIYYSIALFPYRFFQESRINPKSLQLEKISLMEKKEFLDLLQAVEKLP